MTKAQLAHQAQEQPTIYLLWAEHTSMFKIGYTKGAVDRRASDIAAMSPIALRIVAETAGGRKHEMHLHQQLRPYRTHGEWFRLPEPVVWAVLDAFGNEDWQQHKQAHARGTDGA